MQKFRFCSSLSIIAFHCYCNPYLLYKEIYDLNLQWFSLTVFHSLHNNSESWDDHIRKFLHCTIYNNQSPHFVP